MRPLAAALAIAAGLIGTGQQVFRSSAEEVRVDVLVTDGRRPVAGLTAPSFELLDSGVAQTIEHLDVSEYPFSMLLALDTSSSMNGVALRQLQDGARAAIGALRADDRASLMTFNAAIAPITRWSAERRPLADAIEHLQADGTTSLYDAAVAAIVQRDPEPGRRNLLILFTDGSDTSSWLPDSAAYDLAARTDIVVYGISTGAAPARVTPLQWRSGIRLSRGQPVVSSADFLSTLAARTGGNHLHSAGTDLRAAFTQIVSEFRTRYVLYYRPVGVPAAGWHPIDVRLKGRRGQVTARRGYER